jgi:hypothetical protein
VLPQGTTPVSVVVVLGVAREWHEGLSYLVPLLFNKTHYLLLAHSHPRYRRAFCGAPKGEDERPKDHGDFQYYARSSEARKGALKKEKAVRVSPGGF